MQADDIRGVIGHELKKTLSILNGVIGGSELVRFENLTAQGTKLTLQSHFLLNFIELRDVNMTTRGDEVAANPCSIRVPPAETADRGIAVSEHGGHALDVITKDLIVIGANR